MSYCRFYLISSKKSKENINGIKKILVGSERLVLSSSGTLANANVGSNKTVTIGSLSLGNGSNGGLAANYTLSGGTHTLTVNQRVVNVSGTRLYNALATAVASDLSTMTNLVGSETLTLSSNGTIASKDVGSNKTVTIGSLSLGNGSNGGLAANYTLTGGTHRLTVNQRPLNATIARQYDGTTNAAGSDISSFNDLQSSETLTMTGTGTVSSKNVANGQSVTVGSLALADGSNGGLASYYNLNSASLNISKRVLNSSG